MARSASAGAAGSRAASAARRRSAVDSGSAGADAAVSAPKPGSVAWLLRCLGRLSSIESVTGWGAGITAQLHGRAQGVDVSGGSETLYVGDLPRRYVRERDAWAARERAI